LWRAHGAAAAAERRQRLPKFGPRDLFVKTKSFRQKNKGGPVEIAKSNSFCARLHFLFKSIDGTLLWVGLVMTAAAAIAQAVKSAQSTPSMCWIVGAAVFQIVGLILALIGAVRTRKP
jgi:hypothetical protein